MSPLAEALKDPAWPADTVRVSRAPRGDRWHAHPVRAAAIRAVAFVVPLGASVAAGVGLASVLPPTSSLLGAVAVWLLVLVVSTLVMLGVDRATRRLLPIATLLKLSMAFPDKAPSRFKVARQSAGTRALAAELERARQSGVTGDRQQAAETILALVGALGDYDSRTRGHSERTQLFVTMLAEQLKLKQGDRDRLMWAALIHDIGKLRVPGPVLNKPGTPTEEEWELLRRHPVDGATIISPLTEWLGPWALAVEQHHERWDGQGYPHGLAGEQISLAGRVVAVADAYEVMTAARPYKKAMSTVAARAELARCAGEQFDPAVVRAFLNISLGRMRWAAGPLAWISQIPFLRPIPGVGQTVSQAAGAVSGAAATVAGLVTLGLAPVLGATGEPAAASPAPRPQVQAPAATTPSAQPEEPWQAPIYEEPAYEAPSPSDVPGPVVADPVPTAFPGAAPDATPANWLPVATSDLAAVDEDAPATLVDVLANDSDPDGDTLTVTDVSAAGHGSVTLSAGRVRYSPAVDYAGPDTFTYTVSDGEESTTAVVDVTVSPVNDDPVAGADSVTVAEDASATTVSVLADDSDVDGDTLTVASVTQPANGTAVVATGSRTVSYTPDADFSGSDAFTYTVVDGNGGSATATVTATVTSVNDAPVADDESVTVAEDAPATPVDVLAGDTDVDGDTLTVSSVTQPASGSVSVTNGGRDVSYTPDPEFSGSDSFTYTVDDGSGGTDTGTVTVTVSPVDDAPVAATDSYSTQTGLPVSGNVLANDSDEEGDTLTVTADTASGFSVAANGDFTFPGSATPVVVSFTYTVSDGNGGTATGTVQITVTAAAVTSQSLYLHGGATNAVGVMNGIAPSAADGTDWDGDLAPGLTVKSSGQDVDETDERKFQEWEYSVPGGGLTFNGAVDLDLWSSTSLNLNKDVDYSVWLWDCDASGASCTLLTSTRKVHVDNWNTAIFYQQRTVSVGSVHTTVTAGRKLKVRLAFGHNDVWLPLSVSYPSRLVYTTGG